MREPNVLIYDLETSPYLIEAWGTYQVDALRVIRESYILCFAYKWAHEKRTHVVALPDFKTYKKDPHNDVELIQELHKLFNEADVLVAHNGDRFDQKRSQARFLLHGLEPPTGHQSIDTLKVARKHFALSSNRLDALGDLLKVGRKVQHTGKSLWFDCMAGKKAAWDMMKKYNKQDVDLLEAIYLKLRPWMDTHPNMSVYTGELGCPKCGSKKLKAHGYRYSRTSRIKRYRCGDCKGMCTERTAVKEDRPNIK